MGSQTYKSSWAGRLLMWSGLTLDLSSSLCPLAFLITFASCRDALFLFTNIFCLVHVVTVLLNCLVLIYYIHILPLKCYFSCTFYVT